MSKRFDTFAEFWPFYVMEHSRSGTRILHFIGTTLLWICIALMIFSGSAWFLLFGVVLAYGFAWTGHFFIEKNRPATFKHPFFSLVGDFKMYALMITGKMGKEIERCAAQRTILQ
jgi:hypothetical protein